MTGFSIDAGGDTGVTPAGVLSGAADAEAEGFDGYIATETTHDALVLLTLAATATSRIDLLSGIAVAFARNPMATAIAANDIQLASGGRLQLGLGSQVKTHIERRFSMPWSKPAARMREYVEALRAIWTSWETGGPLRFQGEFYQHTLMTPFFSPGPNPHGQPPVWVAAVGEQMATTAGEVADGVICHVFTTPRYLAEVTLPAVERGRSAAGRAQGSFGLAIPAFVTLGRDQRELDVASALTKARIAFYASTPAYRPVLELHGWEEIGDALNARSRRGEWATMGELVTDEMLHEFSIVGDLDAVADGIRSRFDGVATRISFYSAQEHEPSVWRELMTRLR